MVIETIEWGVKASLVTGDSWYSGIENLKFLREQKLGFLFGVEKNRVVSNEPHKYRQVSKLEVSEEGLVLSGAENFSESQVGKTVTRENSIRVSKSFRFLSEAEADGGLRRGKLAKLGIGRL
jgi:hypothetical protein